MKRLMVFCATAGLLLSSATPPPRVEPELAEIGAAQPPAPPALELAALAETAPIPEPQEAAAPAPPPAEPKPQVAEPEPEASTPAAALAAIAEQKTAEPDEEAEPVKPSWSERSKALGAVRVVISIPQQKAYVFRHGELVATSPVSTGKRGHETPTGTFPIMQKKVHHRSSKYDNAPMPYMQRLTASGIALHAGSLPGYPASHGCIRLPRSFAKKLYGLTSSGTRVTITKRRPKSAKDALALA